jgi:hypothetical protein
MLPYTPLAPDPVSVTMPSHGLHGVEYALQGLAASVSEDVQKAQRPAAMGTSHATLPIRGGTPQQPMVARPSDTDSVHQQVQPIQATLN